MTNGYRSVIGLLCLILRLLSYELAMLYSDLSADLLSLMDAFDDISGISLQIHDDFKPVYISTNMLRQYGFSSVQEYLSLDSILELVPPESQEQALARYKQLMTVGKTEPLIIENWGPRHQAMTIQVQDKRILVQGKPMALTVIQDISEHFEQRRVLTELAMIDELTGIANRRSFLSRGEALLKAFPNYSGAFLLDIDHFKAINDNYGHDVGDAVLKQFAETCQQCLRTTDLIARLGGDEFIVLVPEIGKDYAVTLAKKINSAIASTAMGLGEGEALHITTSIGIALSSPQLTLSALISLADDALYHVKDNGRNGYALLESS